MPIEDKAPDTPSRMRPPSARVPDVLSVPSSMENKDNGSRQASVSAKRKADEAIMAKRSTAARTTAAPSAKVSSLSNPRIAAASRGAPVQPPPPLPLPLPARKDWHTDARLKDIERLLQEMQEKVSSSDQSNSATLAQLSLAESRAKDLEGAKAGLEQVLGRREREIAGLDETIGQLQRRIAQLQTESEASVEKLKHDFASGMDAAQREQDGLQRELEACVAKLDARTAEASALMASLSAQSAAIVELQAHVALYKSRLETCELQVAEKTELLERSHQHVLSLQHQAALLAQKLYDGECTRRRLHNDLQELKGNIRVFCRVRPFLPGEPAEEALRIPGDKAIGEPEDIVVVHKSDSAMGALTKALPFSFDRVFAPASSQEAVFDEIAQLVQSALDGYRVCIFAYGQTGSGKTFTMEGRPGDPGMIPRAVSQIFDSASRLAERGWAFQFEASFLEIYNETIRDLLNDKENSAQASHEIRHNGSKTTVSDLAVLPVASVQAVMDVLQLAGKNRAVAETLCNERSSRSHSVFSLRISGANQGTLEGIEGLLNLIDLAGSERLSQSGSTGDRLKETQAINKSLSALGDVIAALASKEAHIPFRNSKLTYLLQNSLGGSSKTLMFVNVSPCASSVPETLCSLRFATKVNSCHIGTARKNAK